MGGTFQTSNIKHESSASNNITLTSDGKTTFGNDIVLGSGKGIVFDGTVGGNVTSKTLEDYEEGTWTPTIYGTVNAGTASYSERYGYYTKIGRVVEVNLFMYGSFSSAPSGGVAIQGLPFTVGFASKQIPAVKAAIGHASDAAYAYATNPSYIYFGFTRGVSDTLYTLPFGAGHSTTSFQMHLMLTYFTE